MYDAWYANSQNATRFWNDIINCYGYTILYIYCLKIAGPSSTFFIVTFSLPINLPIAPEEALYRGFAILVGGILATMMVLITIVFSKNKAEEQAIQNDFKLISKLLHTYNDKSAFLQVAKTAVDSFKASDKLLITSTSSNDKLSRRFQNYYYYTHLPKGFILNC